MRLRTKILYSLALIALVSVLGGVINAGVQMAFQTGRPVVATFDLTLGTMVANAIAFVGLFVFWREELAALLGDSGVST